MALRSCPHCGHTVSDLAARCLWCKAALAPVSAEQPAGYPGAAPPYPPQQQHGYPQQHAYPPHGYAAPPPHGYAPPPSQTGALMRIGQVLAVLVCLATGFVAAQGESSAEWMGYAVGAGVAPLLLAAIFLAWSRRTRPFIPYLGLGLALMSSMGRASIDRGEVDRELGTTRGLMSALMDSAGSVTPGTTSAPPEGDRAKLVWATNRALAEVPAYYREVAARHQIDPDNLPPAWGTSAYLSAAGEHPEVGRYWEAYQAYLADFRENYPAWLVSRVETHARGAGVRSGMLRDYVTGMRRGADMTQAESLVWADSTAAAALEYHRFLVAADSRISYDAGSDMAMFERDADLDRAKLLEARVNTAASRLQRAQAEDRRQGLEKVDSMAALMR